MNFHLRPLDNLLLFCCGWHSPEGIEDVMNIVYRVGQKSDTSTNYITLYERYHFFGLPCIVASNYAQFHTFIH